MRGRGSGFTLTELAVVLTVVGLLLAGAIYTLGAQMEQRNLSDTQRRLDDAKDLLLAYALVNGRLPCPAAPGTTGDESPAGGAAACTNPYDGFLPARTLGYQPIDAAGYGIDAWGNRLRYAVSATQWGVAPFARFTKQHVPNSTSAAWSITQMPADLVVCRSSPAVAAQPTCDAGSAVTNQNTVVALVFSTGKNGASGAAGANEARNLDTVPLFVSRPPDPIGAASGEFDDMMVWIPVGVLYSRLIAAGVLP